MRDQHMGHDVLMDGIQTLRHQIPPVSRAVIGDGPLRLNCQARAESVGLAAVADAVGFLLVDPAVATRLGAAEACRAQHLARTRVAARAEDLMVAVSAG
jgi:hypothetical protein